nr:nuclease-related domain-containing protein [Micromonospora sp. DSM 115978]
MGAQTRLHPRPEGLSGQFWRLVRCALRMIPAVPAVGTSRAELAVFRHLSQVENSGWDAALHSLKLPEHQRKRVSEIDFVLVGRRGLLVLEVKGGGVSQQAGVWYTQDFYGEKHRLVESPFQQAQSAMFALEGILGKKLGGGTVRRTVVGFGVVLPDCTFDVDSAEWSDDVLLDGPAMRSNGFDRYLDRLVSYWERKQSSRGPLADSDVTNYLRVLRPDFDRVPNLRHVSSR